MKILLPESSSLQACPSSLFIKDSKLYVRNGSSLAAVAPRRSKKRTLHSSVILSSGEADDGTWHGTLKEGVQELIKLQDNGTSTPQDATVTQDQLQWMPWVGFTKAAYRLTTEYNGSASDFRIILHRKELEGTVSPAETITFTLYFGTDWNLPSGAPRWFLRSIEFEPVDSRVSRFMIVTNNKRSTDDRDVLHQGGLLSRDYGTDYEKRQSVGLVTVTSNISTDISRAYIGAYDYTAHGNRNKKGDLMNNYPYEAFFLAVMAKVGAIINGRYNPYNYDLGEDDPSYISLEWCRYFSSSSAALTSDASFNDMVYNVYLTEQPYFAFNDFWTQRQNMILNGNANSSLTYVKMLIDKIFNLEPVLQVLPKLTITDCLTLECKKNRRNQNYIELNLLSNTSFIENTGVLESFGTSWTPAKDGFIQRILVLYKSEKVYEITFIGSKVDDNSWKIDTVINPKS
jgi:hypothetical protein